MDPRVALVDHLAEEAVAHQEAVLAMDQDKPQEGLN